MKKKTQYEQGWEDAMEQEENIREAVAQIKEWNKYGEAEFNWGIILVIVLTLGVVASIMIANNHAINNF